MKPLTTEADVWKWLAQKFARLIKTWKRGDGAKNLGICYQLCRLRSHQRITPDLARSCSQIIHNYRLHHAGLPPYFWPLTKGGAKHREAFCRMHGGLGPKKSK